MVEPTDGAEVESGELRWPPDEPSSPDAQTERARAEEGATGEEEFLQSERGSTILFFICMVGRVDLNSTFNSVFTLPFTCCFILFY